MGFIKKGVSILPQSALDFFATQGPWAFLFVLLLYWVLKENAKREERLIHCLDELSGKYDTISHDVGEIKDIVKGRI